MSGLQVYLDIPRNEVEEPAITNGHKLGGGLWSLGGQGVAYDEQTGAMFLTPLPLTGAYRDAAQADPGDPCYRLHKADFALTSAAWEEVGYLFPADTYLLASETNREVILSLKTYPVNTGWWLSYYLYDKRTLVTDLVLDFAFGQFRLYLYSNGMIVLYENGVQAGAGALTAAGQPEVTSGQRQGLYILPYRRRELLIGSSLGGSLRLGTVADMRRMSVEIGDPSLTDYQIIDEGQIALQFPYRRAHVQIMPLTFEAAGSITYPAIHYQTAPQIVPQREEIKDVPPGCLLSVSNTDADGNAFTGAQTTLVTRVAMQASPDRRRTPFLYGWQAHIPCRGRWITPLLVDASGDVTRLRWNLTEDPGDRRLEMELRDTEGAYATSIRKSRMGVGIDLDGQRVFTGLTVRTHYRQGKEANRISFDASDGWARLQTQYLTHARSYGGWVHTDVIRDLARHAGLDDTEMSIWPDTWTLPQAEPDDADNDPLKPENGQSVADFMRYICETWTGWDLQFGVDGKLYYGPQGWFGAWAGEFKSTTVFGSNDATYQTLEWDVEEPVANEVWAVGENAAGDVIGGVWVDWASILDPLAENFLGERRVSIYVDPAIKTQEQANWVAARLGPVLSKATVRANIRSQMVYGLWPGIEVSLQDYAGTWMITAMDMEVRKASDEADGLTLLPANYVLRQYRPLPQVITE